MRALQYREIGMPPEVVHVPDPAPGPGQVLLKVLAAGACHSDQFIMDLAPKQYGHGLPLTLGHEGVGVVAAVGAGVTGVDVGRTYAVYGPWGCGLCRACASGAENYCLSSKDLCVRPPGLGSPGTMADYIVVPSARHLVPLDGLDPVTAAPLTDAGLTPYHAIRASLPKLVPGATAVVIGVGGLGHMAIQILRALSPARVIALDIEDTKLEFATAVGAHYALMSAPSAAQTVRDLTGGSGATLVLDFVGAHQTAELAAALVGPRGDIALVGVGPGRIPVGIHSLPFGTRVWSPYWGTRPELFEVLDLARTGQLSVEVETFSLDEAPLAYERMRSRKLRGRAVIVP